MEQNNKTFNWCKEKNGFPKIRNRNGDTALRNNLPNKYVQKNLDSHNCTKSKQVNISSEHNRNLHFINAAAGLNEQMEDRAVHSF